MSRILSIALLAGIPVVATVGCSTAPSTHSERVDLRSESTLAIDHAVSIDPTLRPVLDRAAGYAVFPDAGKGGFVVGAGYGKGVLYEKNQPVGYCDLTSGSVGATIGGQSFSEILVFQTPDSLQKFKDGKFTFDAEASAVALDKGTASQAAMAANNVLAFIYSDKGLMADASVSGQNFRYTPMDIGNVQPAGSHLDSNMNYKSDYDSRHPSSDRPWKDNQD